MSDFIYFVKLFGLTLALVVLMQINVGGQSVESHAMLWLQSSTVVAPLNSVAHGGGKMVHDLSDRVHGAIRTNRSKKKKDEKDGTASSRFHWSNRAPSKSEDVDDGDPD